MTDKHVVTALLDRAGHTYADDAGIRLSDTPAPLYRLLVLSVLLSTRIKADIAVAAAAELARAGFGTPARMRRPPGRTGSTRSAGPTTSATTSRPQPHSATEPSCSAPSTATICAGCASALNATRPRSGSCSPHFPGSAPSAPTSSAATPRRCGPNCDRPSTARRSTARNGSVSPRRPPTSRSWCRPLSWLCWPRRWYGRRSTSLWPRRCERRERGGQARRVPAQARSRTDR